MQAAGQNRFAAETWGELAYVYTTLGRQDAATDALDRSFGFWQGLGMPLDVYWTAYFDTVRARIAAAEEDWPEAELRVAAWLGRANPDDLRFIIESSYFDRSELLLTAHAAVLVLEARGRVEVAATVARSAVALMRADRYQGWSVEPDNLERVADRLPDPERLITSEIELFEMLRAEFIT